MSLIQSLGTAADFDSTELKLFQYALVLKDFPQTTNKGHIRIRMATRLPIRDRGADVPHCGRMTERTLQSWNILQCRMVERADNSVSKASAARVEFPSPGGAMSVSSSFSRFLKEFPRTFIAARELEEHCGDYAECIRQVGQAVATGTLTPVKRSGTNGRIPSLAGRYRIRRFRRPPPDELRATLFALPAPMNPHVYYERHAEHFQQDQDVINALAAFLRRSRSEDRVRIPANERSFEVFGDEKLLLTAGVTILKRLGLTLDDLACFSTSEPFVFFSYAAPARKILISENRDSFLSLHRTAHGGRRVLGTDTIDAMVYGEGRKIVRSLSYAAEAFQQPIGALDFLYWGDLDREGARIFLDLRAAFPDVSIRPANALYEAMLVCHGQAPPNARSGRSLQIGEFYEAFPPPLKAAVREILEGGRYLPQESVTYPKLEMLLRAT